MNKGRLSPAGGFDSPTETDMEVYYRFQATPWAGITPHVQYIADPGGNPDSRDAVVVGVRVYILF